jgi:hypothetical protein
MSKIIEIKASTWTREDLPGYHVRYTLPADSQIMIDEQLITLSPQVDTKKLTIGPVEGEGGGKGSVIAQVLTGGFMQTDASGNLVYKDGTLHTVATPNDPWPAVCDGVEALLQFQFDHNNRPDQIYVDGVKFGQPGSDPGVRYAARDNKLYLEFSPPVGTRVEGPVVAANDTEPARITIPPPAGHQVDVVLNGPSIVTLTNIPGATVPGRLGFVRLTDMAGEQMPTGVVSVRDELGGFLYESEANGFGCNISVGDVAMGSQVYAHIGETLTVSALGLSGPVLMSYRDPAW